MASNSVSRRWAVAAALLVAAGSSLANDAAPDSFAALSAVGVPIVSNMSAPISPNVLQVPEPGTYALMSLGLAALAWRARRR
jgi:hypothetical protein